MWHNFLKNDRKHQCQMWTLLKTPFRHGMHSMCNWLIFLKMTSTTVLGDVDIDFMQMRCLIDSSSWIGSVISRISPLFNGHDHSMIVVPALQTDSWNTLIMMIVQGFGFPHCLMVHYTNMTSQWGYPDGMSPEGGWFSLRAKPITAFDLH